jgi:hypothetical protein
MSYSSKLTSKFKLTSVSNKLGAPIDGSFTQRKYDFCRQGRREVYPPPQKKKKKKKLLIIQIQLNFQRRMFYNIKDPILFVFNQQAPNKNRGDTFKFKSGFRNQDQKMP